MPETSTTRCRDHGHPEFTIRYSDETPVEQVRWLARHLEEVVADGGEFQAGQMLQLGWLPVQIQPDSGGGLTLTEPDLAPGASGWVDSVSRALTDLWQQTEVLRALRMERSASFPSITQLATVCSRLAVTDTLVLDRSESEGEVSGWYLCCGDADHDHEDPEQLQDVSLHAIVAELQPSLVPFFALPPETMIAIGEQLRIFHDGREVSPDLGILRPVLERVGLVREGMRG